MRTKQVTLDDSITEMLSRLNDAGQAAHYKLGQSRWSSRRRDLVRKGMHIGVSTRILCPRRDATAAKPKADSFETPRHSIKTWPCGRASETLSRRIHAARAGSVKMNGCSTRAVPAGGGSSLRANNRSSNRSLARQAQPPASAPLL